MTLALLCSLFAGCAGTATVRSRVAAQVSQKIVTQFRLAQQQRVEKVNAQYQKNYQQLTKKLSELLQKDTEQSLDLNALQFSDALITDWTAQTLPAAFRKSFLQIAQSDYEKMRREEATLNNARNTYATNYANASVPLNLLRQIENNLTVLTTKPKNSKQISAAMGALWDAYRKTTQSKLP